MKTLTKVLLTLAALVFPSVVLVPVASAQAPVLVTATITAASNLAPYASGTYQAQLVDANGNLIPGNGLPVSYSGSLTSVGALSVTINPNSAFVSGSQWKFTICSQTPNSSLPITVQAQKCFSQAVTITGAGDISATLSASAPNIYYFNPVTGALYSANAAGGVTKIVAGTNITLSPSGGTGDVTVNASGGGSGIVSGQAVNVVGKATASTTTGAQSSITDDGTTVAINEPVTITESTIPFLGLTVASCGSGSLPTFTQFPNILINCTHPTAWGGIDILTSAGDGEGFVSFGDSATEINAEVRGYMNGASSGLALFARGNISLNATTNHAAQFDLNASSATFTVPVLMPTGSTAVTQSASDNTTKVATTAYVDTALSGKQASGTYVTPTTLNNNTLPASVTTLAASGAVSGAGFSTATNCSSSASPAVCAAAAAGSVALPTNAVSSSIVVNTTAVTANSQILVTTDDTLGTKLGVTCNSTVATLVGGLTISARTAGTSFTIANNVAVVTNPLCVSYFILN